MKAHHPSKELIQQFAHGDHEGSIAAVVSAHVSICDECQKHLHQMEAKIASKWDEVNVLDASAETEKAWKQISSLLNEKPKANSKPSRTSHLIIDGKEYELPKSLSSLQPKDVKWTSFGKGGKISKLRQDGNKSLFLIYLASNEEVPQHSHEGQEHSYVVSGRFMAEGVEFQTGDFASSDQSTVHTPKATSEDGCLLLSSVENRLNFFQGFLKALNGPFWHYLISKMN